MEFSCGTAVRIQHYHYSRELGGCSGVGLIPGLGTSTCHWCSQKNPTKQKNQKKKKKKKKPKSQKKTPKPKFGYFASNAQIPWYVYLNHLNFSITSDLNLLGIFSILNKLISHRRQYIYIKLVLWDRISKSQRSIVDTKWIGVWQGR